VSDLIDGVAGGVHVTTLLKIGQLSTLVGVRASTLRYYESLGFIHPVVRHDNGYRYYSTDVIQKIDFIKKAQQIGFSLAQIDTILNLRKEQRSPCSLVKHLLDEKIDHIEGQIQQLISKKQDLLAYQAVWREQRELSLQGAKECPEIICHYIEAIEKSTEQVVTA
jgi:DNA-binding transcriptional MerR regulator